MTSLLDRAAAAVSRVLPGSTPTAPKEPWDYMSSGDQPHALELAWRLYGRSIIDDCRRSLGELDKYITRHGSVIGDLCWRVNDKQNPFRNTRLIIRLRCQTLARVAWLEERAKGKELPLPEPVEPTGEELIREYVNTVGFKAIEHIMGGGARVIHKCQEHLKKIKLDLKYGLHCYKDVTRVDRDWPIVDARIEALIADIPATEARLEASIDAHGRLVNVLVRCFKEVVESAGVEKVSRAFVDAKVSEITAAPPLSPAEEDRRELEAAKIRIHEYVKGLGHDKEVSELMEAKLLETERKNIADHRTRSVHDSEAAREVEALRAVGDVRRMLDRGLSGYTELGAMAAKHPNKFPPGFVNRMIDASTKAFVDVDIATCASWLEEC